jgi:glutamate 5-kinase
MERKELIVIKIGSNVLTDKKGRLDKNRFREIAVQIKKFYRYDKKIVIVSSGAIACGTEYLRIDFLNRTIPQKQAAAAVGQNLLMGYYHRFLSPVKVGQLLLTADAIKDQYRAENIRNTINELLKLKVIPIINENDSVVVDEIRFGDNDLLSAQVAVLLNANKLIIMTDIDGLYNKNPKMYSNAKLIKQVMKITPDIQKLAGGAGSHKGTGGMASKLLAAKLATENGVDTYVANGFKKSILIDIINRTAVCTFFNNGK